jgi:hypothetical protein
MLALTTTPAPTASANNPAPSTSPKCKWSRGQWLPRLNAGRLGRSWRCVRGINDLSTHLQRHHHSPQRQRLHPPRPPATATTANIWTGLRLATPLSPHQPPPAPGPDYIAFWDALTTSTIYAAIREQSFTSLPMNTLATEFIALIGDAKAGRANEAAIQASMAAILTTGTFTAAQITELQTALVAGHLEGIYEHPLRHPLTLAAICLQRALRSATKPSSCNALPPSTAKAGIQQRQGDRAANLGG